MVYVGDGIFSDNDQRDIIMYDESYFTLTGSGMPGNRGFYSTIPKIAPDDVRLRFEEKNHTK